MWKLFVILFLSSVIGIQDFSQRPPELVEQEDLYPQDDPKVLKLWGSIYHAKKSQCDNTPFITADGSRIDPRNPGKHRYVALSRDLIRPFVTNHELYGYNPEALFQFGDTILVQGRKGDEMERVIVVELYTMFNKLKKIIPISFIVLTQLNRGIESAIRLSEPSQQFPKKADLFASDATYQFSDVVMISVNPQQLGLESYGPAHWPVDGRLYWHFLKLREGMPCVAMMQNQLKHNTITDYPQQTT